MWTRISKASWAPRSNCYRSLHSYREVITANRIEMQTKPRSRKSFARWKRKHVTTCSDWWSLIASKQWLISSWRCWKIWWIGVRSKTMTLTTSWIAFLILKMNFSSCVRPETIWTGRTSWQSHQKGRMSSSLKSLSKLSKSKRWTRSSRTSSRHRKRKSLRWKRSKS